MYALLDDHCVPHMPPSSSQNQPRRDRHVRSARAQVQPGQVRFKCGYNIIYSRMRSHNSISMYRNLRRPYSAASRSSSAPRTTYTADAQPPKRLQQPRTTPVPAAAGVHTPSYPYESEAAGENARSARGSKFRTKACPGTPVRRSQRSAAARNVGRTRGASPSESATGNTPRRRSQDARCQGHNARCVAVNALMHETTLHICTSRRRSALHATHTRASACTETRRRHHNIATYLPHTRHASAPHPASRNREAHALRTMRPVRYPVSALGCNARMPSCGQLQNVSTR